MALMGAKSKLDIETDQLHKAAGKAGQTLAASVIPSIMPPPPAATSQLDIALAAVSAKSELLRSKVDVTDSTWATRQSGALAEGPTVLQSQDKAAVPTYQQPTEYPMPAFHPLQPSGGTMPA
jgi:hypothetical protein